jgi:hypothetical protein
MLTEFPTGQTYTDLPPKLLQEPYAVRKDPLNYFPL